MKTTHFMLIAITLVAIAVLISIDSSAVLIAPAALAITEEGLEELARAFKKKTEEVEETRSELLSRMQEVEMSVSKRIKGVAGLNTAPSKFQLDLTSMTGSEQFRLFKESPQTTLKTDRFSLGELSFKSLFNDIGEPDSVNGTLPSRPDHISGYHGYVLQPLRLGNLLPVAPARSNSFDFVRLAFTGDAGMQEGEGAEKAEMDFDGTLHTGRIQTVAVHTTTSTQVLEDNDTLLLELERILTHKLRGKVEEQLLVGSGTGSNLEGIYTASTVISTPWAETPDRIGSAITTMETQGYLPNAILMNPADWFAVSVMKDGEGRYLYGNPASPAPASLWNRPVITNPAIPVGMALVADTTRASVRDRLQPTVFYSRHHKDYATRNLVLILIEARLGLAIYDEGAFRRVDLASS